MSPSHPDPAGHDIRVATCALLLEMSHIDGEFSDSERDHIMSMMKHDHGLSDEEASALMTASQEELQNSVDLWRFASLINQNYSPLEKRKIIETVWRVAYADGHLEKHEDYLIHKLARLFRLPHSRLIEAKMKVMDEV